MEKVEEKFCKDCRSYQDKQCAVWKKYTARKKTCDAWGKRTNG